MYLTDESLRERVEGTKAHLEQLSPEERENLLAEIVVAVGWCIEITKSNFDTLYDEMQGRMIGLEAALSEAQARIEILEEMKQVH